MNSNDKIVQFIYWLLIHDEIEIPRLMKILSDLNTGNLNTPIPNANLAAFIQDLATLLQ